MSRVLLAFAPPEILEEVVAQGIQPVTDRTPGEADLRTGLAEIVLTGIALSEGEYVAGSVVMAVPILREDGILAALAVAGPESRCGLPWRSRVRRLLPSAAETIMASLAEDRAV
jgi:IclR family acetate operon transcriptional repressor